MRDWDETQPLYHPIVHPEARIGAYVTVDAGFGKPTWIGNSWLMKHVHVGHDAMIGDGVEIAPHTSVGGYAILRDGVKVGQGAVFKPKVIVSENAVIGAGAVVTKDVPANEVWVGNPARKLRDR